ncbi:hypothetical protein PSTT_03279 [Puccinia striiformis]|uniref:Secreted protein n=2 Tax=Puccinia striiformis TaxID=27350 RepID=A0A0L0VT77_9BASI|nr:hypothetical protein PSTG_04333 [Puccinia striiformis f. sp. tritici PST-78]POW13961.1 hypothetical protein PSTT_03279 [Puccinia striiformis]
MKASTTVIFIAPLLSVVHATTHTVCYNYYMQKDGCVFSAAAQDQRCPAPPKDHPAPCKTNSLDMATFTLSTTWQEESKSFVQQY